MSEEISINEERKWRETKGQRIDSHEISVWQQPNQIQELSLKRGKGRVVL